MAEEDIAVYMTRRTVELLSDTLKLNTRRHRQSLFFIRGHGQAGRGIV